jgi:hypothetical protein
LKGAAAGWVEQQQQTDDLEKKRKLSAKASERLQRLPRDWNASVHPAAVHPFVSFTPFREGCLQTQLSPHSLIVRAFPNPLSQTRRHCPATEHSQLPTWPSVSCTSTASGGQALRRRVPAADYTVLSAAHRMHKRGLRACMHCATPPGTRLSWGLLTAPLAPP